MDDQRVLTIVLSAYDPPAENRFFIRPDHYQVNVELVGYRGLMMENGDGPWTDFSQTISLYYIRKYSRWDERTHRHYDYRAGFGINQPEVDDVFLRGKPYITNFELEIHREGPDPYQVVELEFLRMVAEHLRDRVEVWVIVKANVPYVALRPADATALEQRVRVHPSGWPSDWAQV